MTEHMKKAVECLQAAVDEELERKAKLGYKAVVQGKYGEIKVVSAKYLVRKRRAEKRAAETAKAAEQPEM